MQPHGAFLKSIVATAAMLTPAAATWADTSDILYTIVNNSTTPAPADVNDIDEGDLFVSCSTSLIATASRILKDTKHELSCQVPAGTTTHTMAYSVVTGFDSLHSGTVDYDCEATETMVLTFTGSGTNIIYSPSCSVSNKTTDGTTDDTDDTDGDGLTAADPNSD